MKKLFALVWIMWGVLFACALTPDWTPSPQDVPTPRRTGISLPNGDILHEITDKNVSSTNGVMSIDVDEVEETFSIGSGAIFRNNTSSDVLEVSHDGGSTFQVIADTDYVDASAPSSVSATEFALTGTGTGSLASMTVSPTGWVTSGGQFTFFSVVIAESLTRAESFYKITDTEYSANVINFGKTADDRLTLIIGSNTYTSGVVWDATTANIPVEVGVACDTVGGTVTFFFAGQAETEQAATFTYPTINLNEEHILGDALDGSIFFMSLVSRELIAQNTFHTPLREGLSSASQWLVHYNMNAGEGTSVIDRVYEQVGSGTEYTMAVTDGSWVEYIQRY